MKITRIIILAMYGVSCVHTFAPLEDVFDLVHDDEEYSCDAWYNKERPDRSPLGKWWRQVHLLNDAAVHTLMPRVYKEDANSRALAMNFFGIQPGIHGGEPNPHRQSERKDYSRLAQAHRWFTNVGDLIKHVRKDEKKPMMFCGSDHMQPQEPNMPAMDPATGKARSPRMTLLEYERRQGRADDLDHWWYWWVDVASENISGGRLRTYIRWRKRRDGQDSSDSEDSSDDEDSSDGEDSSAAQGSSDGGTSDAQGSSDGGTSDTASSESSPGGLMRPSLCSGKDGYSGYAQYKLAEHNRPTDLGHQPNDWLILCPRRFAVRGPTSRYKSNSLQSLPVASKASLGTRLTVMDTNAHTLFHELVHLAEGNDGSPDPPAIGYWPDRKRPFDRDTWFWGGNIIDSACDAILVALYDRGTQGKLNDFGAPQVRSIMGQWAVHSPDNYFWFALAAWLEAHTEFQWSSGAARPKDGPALGLTETAEVCVRGQLGSVKNKQAEPA